MQQWEGGHVQAKERGLRRKHTCSYFVLGLLFCYGNPRKLIHLGNFPILSFWTVHLLDLVVSVTSASTNMMPWVIAKVERCDPWYSIYSGIMRHHLRCMHETFMLTWNHIHSFPGGSVVKQSACDVGDPASIPELRRSPGEENGNPFPVFLPGKFHGQRSLAGYSPWGRRVR